MPRSAVSHRRVSGRMKIRTPHPGDRSVNDSITRTGQLLDRRLGGTAKSNTIERTERTTETADDKSDIIVEGHCAKPRCCGKVETAPALSL